MPKNLRWQTLNPKKFLLADEPFWFFLDDFDFLCIDRGGFHRTLARKPLTSVAGGIAFARSALCGKIKPLAFKSLCMAPNPMVRTGVFGGRHPRLPQSGGSTGSVAVLHRGANIGGLARLPSRQGLL